MITIGTSIFYIFRQKLYIIHATYSLVTLDNYNACLLIFYCSILCVQGFAFVSYSRREDAAEAIKNLDGYGYDHLILKVEWAK